MLPVPNVSHSKYLFMFASVHDCGNVGVCLYNYLCLYMCVCNNVCVCVCVYLPNLRPFTKTTRTNDRIDFIAGKSVYFNLICH